ncbi:MAG TPA: CHAT domain-containing protein, partial [Mesotoga sp.]|nr:CHAT domain-containing protein [Mesotoga sp.]
IRRAKLGADHPGVAETLNSLALAYQSADDYKTAIEHYSESLKILKVKFGEDHLSVGTILNNLGAAYNSTGEYGKATEVLQEALRIRSIKLGEDHPEVAFILRSMALVSLSTNEIENALEKFLQALESLNRFILLRGHTQNSVSKFIEDNVLLSEYILSVLVLTDSPAEKKEESYEALLNAKVIGYQVAMNVYLSILSGNHLQLSEKFDLLCIKRAEYSNLLLKNPTDAKEREEALLEEIDSLERELAIQIPELETDIESRIVSLKKMRGSIPESSVLLDFYHYREVILGEKKKPEFGKGKYGLFKVKREGEIELIDLGYSDEIDEKIKVFREEIVPKSEMTSGERKKGLETVKQLAGELYDSLLSKALTNEEIERIMISPDGMLNFLPFETLVNENKYLVEKFKITYLSSPKDIVRFNNIKGSGTKDIHIYSHPDYDFNFPGGEKPEKDIEPPETKGMTIKSLREKGLEFKSLEFSGKYEVDSISRAAEGTSLNLKDPKTKEAAHEHSIREIKKPAILHISTHGFFLDKEKEKPELMELQVFGEMGPMIRYDDPLKRSGLALAGVNRVIKGEPVCEEVEDGILTAYDIVSLDIYGAELVVLSACDTGIGEIKTGQGVMGFRRSFTLAGVKTLVMSLWEVPTNETAILMENFYDNLFRGKGKADSLREAQLKMMKDDYDDPYYWGAFIVQGENNII